MHISHILEGIHSAVTTHQTPNIVVTPPQEVNDMLHQPSFIPYRDATLLYPSYQHPFSRFYRLHRVLTPEEFEEEENYLYGSSQ
jgi:hypothetical protein